MFNVQTHTASAVHAARDAASKAEKATGKVASTMTALFVAFIVADPTLSLKAVSTLVGEKVPQSKGGGVAAVHKSRANTFFKDDANLANARKAIPSPEAMTPEEFDAAVTAYAASINPRKWIEEQKAGKATTAIEQEQAKTDNIREEGDDEAGLTVLNPDYNPVLDCQTTASKAIAALLDNASPEATQALETLFAMLDKGLTARAAPSQEAIAA
jgi:hypothetical protein